MAKLRQGDFFRHGEFPPRIKVVADFRHKENFHRPAPPHGGNLSCRHAPPCQGKFLKNLHPCLE